MTLLLNHPADALAEAEKEPSEAARQSILHRVYLALDRRAGADAALHQLETKFAGGAYLIAVNYVSSVSHRPHSRRRE